jgi:hypothetical protein
MFEVFDFTPTGTAGARLHSAPLMRETAFGPRATRQRAIELLLGRGFIHLGDDPVGLPCYRSPSGAVLIAVGTCRSLAYAMMGGRLQVVAAARTAALVCRIAPPAVDLPPEPWYKFAVPERAVARVPEFV